MTEMVIDISLAIVKLPHKTLPRPSDRKLHVLIWPVAEIVQVSLVGSGHYFNLAFVLSGAGQPQAGHDPSLFECLSVATSHELDS